jgi:hypothetical protein
MLQELMTIASSSYYMSSHTRRRAARKKGERPNAHNLRLTGDLPANTKLTNK